MPVTNFVFEYYFFYYGGLFCFVSFFLPSPLYFLFWAYSGNLGVSTGFIRKLGFSFSLSTFIMGRFGDHVLMTTNAITLYLISLAPVVFLKMSV